MNNIYDPLKKTLLLSSELEQYQYVYQNTGNLYKRNTLIQVTRIVLYIYVHQTNIRHPSKKTGPNFNVTYRFIHTLTTIKEHRPAYTSIALRYAYQ